MFNELKFTPGVGFSLLIGAVGSIYLIVQSHRYFSKLSQRRRSEVRKPDVVCYMCNANIEVEDTNSFATCRGCERLVCRNEEKQCCEWIPAIGIWECQNCHSSRVIQQKAGEWLLNQLTSRLQNPGPVNLSNEGLLGLSTTDSDDARSCTSSVSSNQKVKVREFIEELLSSMLNGPLDDVSVGQLMENESYLPLIEGQTVPSSPSDTHFELRKMLQKILDEVAKLPSLLNHSGFPLRPEEHLPYFSPKKYEQLLATAVLNKVVEDYRNPKNFEHVKPEADTTTTTTAGPPTTGATSAGSAPATGTTFDINHNKVPGKSLLNEANLRKMSLDKELKEDLYSRSLSESDESYLSDYIQKHTVPLPDLSDTTGSGPEDDVLSLKSNNTDGTWEENWLFKKRQLKSTESSIAMLVPSPTEEVKALIGDKNADEVSDLSEAGSDVEEYDSDSNLKNTTTGDTGSSPKKTLEDHTQDSLISINSIASNEPVLSEAKNELLLEEQQCAVENLVNDLISIEPCSIKTEAANPALIDSQSNAFLSGPESVLIEENNNVIKQEEVETDDIKLMQERIQNAPKQRDVDGNVLHPIGIARTIPVEGHSTECDRKEVPIDRAQSNTEHITRPFETVSEVDVDHPSNPRSNNFKPLQSNMESKSPTTPTIAKTLGDSKASAFVEPLSPRPIALNITEVFERSMNPPLTSISEEDHDRHTSTALQSTDSIISTTDESDSKTVSLSTTTVDTDSSLLLDSWVEIEHYKEDEFSLIDIANETSKQSLDLLELNEASTGAVYVCDTSKIQFAEQLRELRQQQDEQHQHALENEEIMVVGEGEKIRLGQDLVAFNKNAPSPDELQEQCGENEAGLAIGECCTGLTTQVGIGNKLEHDEQECISETSNVGECKSQFVEELIGMIDQNEAKAVIPHFTNVSSVQNKDNVHDASEHKLLEYQQNESHGTEFIATSDDDATTMKQAAEDLLDLTGSTVTSNESCTDQISPTDNETFAEKVSSSSETTTSSVDSVVDLNAHNPIKTDETPNQMSPVENRPSDESEQTELSSPTTSPVHNQPDVLTGTNEALDASDNELPCQSGSSSPTDTSTEAVAGSVDRTSSPEDFYPSTSAISNGQLKLQDDSGLEEREHSTPIAVVTQQMWQYCEELKGILYPRKASEPVATVSEKPPPTTENLQALLLFQEELRAANEDPSQTDIKPCKDHPIRVITTDSSRTPVSESLPSPMEDFAARSAIYNQSIREVDCVEKTIPVAEEVSEVVMDTPYTEEHVVEDTISTDFRDLSIQTIPTDSFSTSVSESLPTPMEDFALRSAEYNHSLRRMDYVEESIPVAEDATCLLTEHLEPSVANEIPTITPSVEEHAVQEAIIIEHTPTPEPIGAVSYERQVTTTVEELKADQEHNHDFLENSTETSKTVKESEVPISMEEKSQCHEPSIDDLQSLSNEKEVPIDVEVSSLVVSQPSVCVVLTNNGDTNLTNAVESDTNTLHDDVQPPSFTSEASIPIAEPDSYHCPPIPAQSEPEKQKPSETSNGHVPAVTTNGVSTDDSVEDEMLIPGSIAEREHLKWRNASPIPNNPYSPDVLQKRLEESNRRSSLIDFDRLASRDPTSPTLEVPDDSELPADSKEEDDAVENDRSLQSVLGANPNQYQRYGRDYYINDAKRACGSRKQTPDLPTQLTHSTDDEKSLLLSQKQEQPTSPISCLEKNDQQPTTEAFPFVKSSSCGNVADKNQSEDIFSAARPIEVKPDDPILKKGTKVEYLSTHAREIYLVPADEPTTPHSLGSSSELSMVSRADESLTFSEDSDVTRIYEIGTGESKVILGDIIGGEKDTGQTPPSTPTYGAQLVDTSHPIDEEQTMNKLNTLKHQESEVLSEEILGIVPQIRAPTPEPIPEEPSSPTIDRSHLLKPHLLKNKPLSPETIKFFSPKKPFSPNLGASSSLSQSTTEIRDLPHHPMNHYHSSLHIDYPPTRPAPIHHDFIIEKEVMEVLPSVKELAKCYSGSQQDVNAVPRPLHRPKDFIRQSSDMLHEEQPQETRSGMPHVENKNRRMYCSTSSITAAEEIREGRRANVEAYNPPTFVPMAPGHSITARSLSKQIRDELKINATDDHKVQGGHTSPERPSSPVFAPGHLRSSIQFFESLREK